MSTAIAMHGLRLRRGEDYDPVSEAARAVRVAWAKSSNYLSRSASDWTPTIEAALREIAIDCRHANWDGEGASPVAEATVLLAGRIAQSLFVLLPKGTPAPDVIAEHDGEISLNWSVDPTRMFSMSIGDHGKINFAGQFGSEGGIHAWQPVDASSQETLEASLGDVVRFIGRLYEPPAAARRAA